MAAASSLSSELGLVIRSDPRPPSSDQQHDLAARVEQAAKDRLPIPIRDRNTTYKAIEYLFSASIPFTGGQLLLLEQSSPSGLPHTATSLMPKGLNDHRLLKYFPKMVLYWLWFLKLHQQIPAALSGKKDLKESYFSEVSKLLSLLCCYPIDSGVWTREKKDPDREFISSVSFNLVVEQPVFQGWMHQIISSLGPKDKKTAEACEELCQLWDSYSAVIKDSPSSLSRMPKALSTPSKNDFLEFATFSKDLITLYSQWSEMSVRDLPINFVAQFKNPNSLVRTQLASRFKFFIRLFTLIGEGCEEVSRSKFTVPDLLKLYLLLVPYLRRKADFNNAFVMITMQESLGLRPEETLNTNPTIWFCNLFTVLGKLPIRCIYGLHHMVWSCLMQHIPVETAMTAIREVGKVLEAINDHYASIDWEAVPKPDETSESSAQAQDRPSQPGGATSYFKTCVLKQREDQDFFRQMLRQLKEGLEIVEQPGCEQEKIKSILKQLLSQILIGLSEFYQLWEEDLLEDPKDPKDPEVIKFLSTFDQPAFREFLSITERTADFLKLVVLGGTDRLLRMLGNEFEKNLSKQLKAQKLEDDQLSSELRPFTQQHPEHASHKKKKKHRQGTDQQNPKVPRSRWDVFVNGTEPFYVEEGQQSADWGSEHPTDWKTILPKKPTTKFSSLDSSGESLRPSALLLHKKCDCPAIQNCALWMNALDNVDLPSSPVGFAKICYQLDLVHRILEALLLHALIRAQVPIPMTHSLISLARRILETGDVSLSQAIEHNWEALSVLSNLNNALHYPHSCSSSHPGYQKLARYLGAMRTTVDLDSHYELLESCRGVIDDLSAGILGRPSPDWKSVPRDFKVLSLPEESSPFFDFSRVDDQAVETAHTCEQQNAIDEIEAPIGPARDHSSARALMHECLRWVEVLGFCGVEGEQHTEVRRQLRNEALANVQMALEMSLSFVTKNPDGLSAIEEFEWIRRAAKECLVAILLHHPAYDESCHVMEHSRRTNSFPKLLELIQRFTRIKLSEAPKWLGYLHEVTRFPFPLPYHNRRPKEVELLANGLIQSDDCALVGLRRKYSFPLLNYLLSSLRSFGQAKSNS